MRHTMFIVASVIAANTSYAIRLDLDTEAEVAPKHQEKFGAKPMWPGNQDAVKDNCCHFWTRDTFEATIKKLHNVCYTEVSKDQIEIG